MISYEFIIEIYHQEIITILMDSYNVDPNEFLFWIRYKHYPVLSTQEKFFFNVKQNFNTTSYGERWIPINLILKRISLESTCRVLSSQVPSSNILHTIEDEWIIVDNDLVGKYVIRNSLYILCNYFPIILSILLLFHLYVLCL